MAERLIHCPFCRRVMARRNGHMYCDFGETGLAPIVEEAILNAIAAVEPATGTNSTSFTSYGFGCPNCTSPLEAYTMSKRVN